MEPTNTSENIGAYNYVVPASRPTAVTHSAVGNFCGPTERNLIIAKGSRLEIHRLNAEGLQGVVDVPVYGRISVLKLFRPRGNSKDLLFLLTEKYKFCVLEYDEATATLVTRANGDASEKIGRPCEAGQIGIIDPDCRLIGLHLYDAYLKIIPIGDNGELQEAFNVRLDELKVLDLAFLHGCKVPTLAILYEDTKEQRHIKTYEVSLKDKDLVEGPWAQSNLESGSSMVIPVANTTGVITVGEQAVLFISGTSVVSITIEPTLVKAYASIDDGSRYLLGDYLGDLFLLVLEGANGRVTSMKLEKLGKTSQASALSYLDTGIVFVGSCFGDSQLIKLRTQPVEGQEPESYIEVVDVMDNLGPIVDFCVVDLDRQGQGQVVTCSGSGVDGSLRIVRNGIGFLEQASVELPGVKGIWSLRRQYNDEHDSYLVLSFVGETRVLGMNMEDELDEAEIPGIDANAQTLWCGNAVCDQLVQVTSTEVRLINGTSQELVKVWTPPEGKNIIVANGNPSQVCVATNAGNVVLINVQDGELAEAGYTAVDGEISCLDLSPIGENRESAELVVVGTWTMKLHLYALPSLSAVASCDIGGEVMPRSVLLAVFENKAHLLCGLGDGTLLNYQLVDGKVLDDRKKLALGTKPITLRTFKASGASHVFAASDRPTVIYSMNGKLVYSNLNENEVSYITSFHTPSFPDSLALVKTGGMTIGTMDSIQKLHVRTVPMQEQPRRIAHQEASRTFLVTTTRVAMATTADGITDSLRLIDDQTYETIDTFSLGQHEMALSVCTMSLQDDAAEYYVVGTAYVVPTEPDPSKGRILLLQVHNGKFQSVYQKETKGAVYNLTSFQGKLLAGINSRVQLYQWAQQEDGSRQLLPECSHSGQILALFIDVQGDYVLVGDIMKSLQVLLYKPDEHKFELRARDFNSRWICAALALDSDTYLGADNHYNLFTLRLNSAAASDEERVRLNVAGQFCLNEFVNKFRRGSLTMRMPDQPLASVPTIIYGCISGTLGVIASLPEETFNLLKRLEKAMNGVVSGVGGFSHEDYRRYYDPLRAVKTDCVGFCDGALVETFLDLSSEKQREVVNHMEGEIVYEDVLRVVEEISRIH